MKFQPVRSEKVWGKTFREKVVVLLATGFYTGYAPVVPGTFGTLVGIPIAFFLSFLGLTSATVILIVMTLLSCWIANEAEKIYGMKDPNDIVIDEVMGYLVTVWALPFTWFTVIGGFFLFRILDILKPFPIRKVEDWIPGGTGVVMDDVLAGVYGCIILHGILRMWHG
ncbi:MAG: phosphatidylglycerophosphatase A [Deltaproteobacteria bacterium]|nr:phosphatidylglycerophosphatase A [Deltaproteobacteria bacterium]